jgi:hypothetical protein
MHESWWGAEYVLCEGVTDEKHKPVFDGTVHFKLKPPDGSGRAGTEDL